MKHYLDSEEHGPFLRLLVLFYAVLVNVVLLSGMAVFYLKTAFGPVQVFEYYRGSEATIALFPAYQDHFINPKTWLGMLKLALPHISGYALVIFITSHLTRSLELGGFAGNLPVITFTLALLEIAGGFLVMAGPFPVVYFRIAVFLLFSLAVFYHNTLLARAVLRVPAPSNHRNF